jgi:sacsin
VVAWQPGPRESGVLRYGRVAEDVRAPSGQALYHVAVETSPGHVQDLLSSTVFSFRSASSVDGGPVPQTATPSPSAIPHSAPRTGPFPQEADNQTRNGDTSSSALGTAGGAVVTAGGAAATAGAPEATAGAPRPQVEPSEVVQAVHDMLAAANLPLGLEEGALMERALGLQEQLGAAETLLEGAERRVLEVRAEAEAAKGAWTCKVCLGEEVTSALVPCGEDSWRDNKSGSIKRLGVRCDGWRSRIVIGPARAFCSPSPNVVFVAVQRLGRALRGFELSFRSL